MAYTGSEISPKDYWKLYDSMYLKTSFINQLREQCNTDCNLNQAFEAMFGMNWVEQPYKTLRAIANKAPKVSDGRDMHRTRYTLNKEIVKRDIAENETVWNSLWARYVAKQYGKQMCERVLEDFKHMSETHIRNNQYRNVLIALTKLDLLARKTNKAVYQNFKAMTKKDQTKTVLLARELSDNINSLNGLKVPESLKTKVTEAVLKAMVNGEDMESLVRKQLGKMAQCAVTAKYYPMGLSRFGDRMRARTYTFIERLIKTGEFCDITNKLGLKTLNRYDYRKLYISPKFIGMLKKVLNNNTSDEVKRDLAVRLSVAEHASNYKTAVYTPVLQSDK